MNFLILYKKIIEELEKSGIKSAEIDAQILLEFVTGKSREFLFAHPEHKLTKNELKKTAICVDRRKSLVPIAYITGKKEFFGLEFLVTPDVLIPRPETEILVEEALDSLKAKSLKLKAILDVGTGSGNIIVSIAKYSKDNPLRFKAIASNLTFFASDISLMALVIAKRNAKKHGVGKMVKFVRSNLFDQIYTKYDVIIANLPYVPIDGSDDREIKHEPQKAIFAGDSGCAIIKKFLDQAQKHINKKGVILTEVDPRNARELKNHASKLYKSVEIKKDFSDIYRMLKILT